MKVHQTLVWLNLLSLGTKGLTEPTIGIQSGLCHGWGLARTASQQRSLTTLLRHFVSICLSTQRALCPAVYWGWLAELSSQLFPPAPPCSMPAGPVRQAPIGRLSLSFANRRRKKWCQNAIQLRGMTSRRHGSRTHTIHTDTYRPGRQVFSSLTQYRCDRQLGQCMLVW